ncbi:MAG: polymer-forming cytoskeletal protein [Rhodospirillales bacterium]|nr:polymer-forming cytoskeletal protein [Rhodospirillales bacterium]
MGEASGELPTLKPFLRASLDEPIPAAARPATPVSPVTAAIARPDLPRRIDMPTTTPPRSLGAAAAPGFGASPSPAAPSPSPSPAAPPVSENEGKKLIVGRDIKLHGEITSCDHLLVEGSVEATLTDGKIIDIAQSGTFNGAVECETASIRGKFEGDLTCTERLVVRSTGRIIGKIRYRQLEVERGGEISGDVQMLQGGAAAQATVTPIFGESEDSRMDPIAAVVSGDR